MTQLREILVATDFSPVADHAVQRAARLARRHGASLRLLHVAPEVRRLGLLPRGRSAARAAVLRAAHLALETVAAKVRGLYGIEPALAIVTGRAHRGILSACRSGPVDLVVVGVVGEHGGLLGDTMVGGTTDKLLDAAPVSLLIVRTPAHADHRLQLVGVDLGPQATQVVAGACALLPDSRVALAAAYDLPYAGRVHSYGFDPHWLDEQLDRMVPELRRELAAVEAAAVPAERRAGTQLLHGDPRRLLPDHAADLAVDCLTLGAVDRAARGRHPLTTFGGVARAVVPQLRCDALLVR